MSPLQQLKKALWRALHPPGILTLLLTVCSAVGLFFVFSRGWSEHPAAYALYALSAYALTVCVLRLAGWLPAALRRLPLVGRCLTDKEFKRRVSLYASFGITLFYCLYKGVAALLFRSPWLGALAFYYILLAGLRLSLLLYIRRGDESAGAAIRRRQFCGGLLFALTLALAAIGYHAVFQGATVQYPGYMIYAAAAFAFFNLTTAIVAFARQRLHDPITAAGNALALSSALVSMFFLESAMLSAFGKNEGWAPPLKAATAAGIFLIITLLALLLLRPAKSKQAP